jgi:multidrug transporter EmrE-like cation transporter
MDEPTIIDGVEGPAPDPHHGIHVAGVMVSEELLFGLLMTFIGLACTAIGLMLQKYALNYYAYYGETSPVYMSKRWIFGMSIFCLGNLIFWAVLALVPQVVLACWQCWAMVVTIFVAPCLLGETVSLWKLLSVIIIVSGVVWVVCASPHEYEKYEAAEFWESISGGVFLTITGGAIVALVVLFGSLAFWTFSRTNRCLRYIFIAAVVNWYSVISARCSSGFLITTIYHAEDIITTRLEFWFLLGAMLLLAIANVHFLNRALEHGEAVFVVPIYEALAIIGQIMFGIVFFNEFEGLSFFQQINLSCALGFTIAGVVASSTKDPPIRCCSQIVLQGNYCGAYCPCCCCCCCPEAETQKIAKWTRAQHDENSRLQGDSGSTGYS